MEGTNATQPAQGQSSGDAYELFILALTLFSLIMVVAYYLLPLGAETKKTILWLDLPISFTFLVDSIRSLNVARSKGAYLRWGWLDFLGSIPLVLPLRIARLRRLIQAWRNLRGHSLRALGEQLKESRVQTVALLMLFLAFVVLTTATAAVLELEKDSPEANIQTGRDAIWFSVVTMSTVGYGDYVPSTTGGRIAALALMTVGVGIYAALVSYLAHLFWPETQPVAGFPEPAEFYQFERIWTQFDAVNAKLDAIQAVLGDREMLSGESGAEPGLAPPGEDHGEALSHE